MQTIVAGLDLGERLLTESAERYGAAALRGTIDYVCDANAERIAEALAELPDGRWEGWDMIDCDGVDDGEEYRVQRGDHQARRSPRGRLQRHLAPGPHLHQRHRAGRQDDGRRGGEVPARSARRVHLGPAIATSTSCCRRARSISALPPDGAVFAYYEQSQVMLSALLRAFAGCAGAARHRRRPRRHRHPQRLRPAARRDAVGLGGPVRRRGRPVRRHAPRRRRDARCSPTRPTAWRPRSRRSRPTSRS